MAFRGRNVFGAFEKRTPGLAVLTPFPTKPSHTPLLKGHKDKNLSPGALRLLLYLILYQYENFHDLYLLMTKTAQTPYPLAAHISLVKVTPTWLIFKH